MKKEKKAEHRFYGFLCKPKLSIPRYELCVLVNHAEKIRYKTDEVNLIIAETLRTTLAVQNAIKNYFEE